MGQHVFSDWKSTGLLCRERKCCYCGLIESSRCGDGGLHWFGWDGITKAPWPRVAPKECVIPTPPKA